MPGGPFGAGETIGYAVELVDIAPTILSYVGAAVPPGMIGVNLMPAIVEKKPLPVRSIPAESESGRMLIAEGRKYIDVPTKAGDF